jgi:TfoX C-terminal domain
MKNMGPKSSEWLASVGIQTLDGDRVAQLGVVGTYNHVKTASPKYDIRILVSIPNYNVVFGGLRSVPEQASGRCHVATEGAE